LNEILFNNSTLESTPFHPNKENSSRERGGNAKEPKRKRKGNRGG
jgi:hypothetical protein